MLWRGAALLLLGLPMVAGAQPAAGEQTAVPDAEPYRVLITVHSGEQSIFDIAGSADRISAQAIRLDNAQVQLSESLGGVPGLLIRDRQNFAQDLQLSIRGFGARSTFGVRGVRLYVDGIPATLPDGQGQTSNIDLGSADRIEVLRGPFSALYGNSSGGVVQVFTENGSGPPRVEADTVYGAYGTSRTGAKISGSSDRVSYVLSGSHFHTDGWRRHSRADRDILNAKLGFDLGGGDKLTLVGNYVNVKGQDPSGLTAEQVREDPRQTAVGEMYNTHKDVEQTQFGLTWNKHVGSNSRLQVMAYGGRRNMEQYLPIPLFVQQKSEGHSGGVVGFARDYYGLDARWTNRTQLASRPFEWTAGLAYDNLHEDRTGHENFVGTELGRRGRLRRNERNTVYSLDPYVQGQWQLAERWRLDAGLRRSRVRFSSHDHYIMGTNGDDSYGAHYRRWLPTASLRYQPNDNWTFYGAVGRGYETPTLNELAYQSGASGVNTDLGPASNISYELGVKGYVAGGWLTAAVFQIDTKDEIVTLDNDNGRSTYQNAGRTRRRGLELSWDYQTPSYWRTQLAYTYLDARYRNSFCTAECLPGTRVPGGNRIPGTVRHVLYASFGWLPPQGWHAGAELRVLSGVYADDQNIARAPGYATTALHAGYARRVGQWDLNAFARVDNAFNRRTIGSVIVNASGDRYFEPAPGHVWSVGIGASYRF